MKKHWLMNPAYGNPINHCVRVEVQTSGVCLVDEQDGQSIFIPAEFVGDFLVWLRDGEAYTIDDIYRLYSWEYVVNSNTSCTRYSISKDSQYISFLIDFDDDTLEVITELIQEMEYEVPEEEDVGMHLPDDAQERKETPVATGLIDYFPDALVMVSQVSWAGNQQHNPGKPLFWDRTKSQDEADALMRHFIDRGTIDKDGIRHSAKVAWRALALLQKELEDARS